MGYDVVIIGGSYAGVSAGLQLARARRRVLVVDGGRRRNRFAGASHGFLTRDGTAAAEIALLAREQLLAYPTVEWREGTVERAEPEDGGFRVHDAGGGAESARRLILATGVTDTLPEVPGLAERWGASVFHCPYCHGYELGGGAVGVLATGAVSMHQALMLPDWGPTTLFLNGAFTPDEEQARQLARRGVAVEMAKVEALRGEPVEVVMEDGRVIPLAGLFVASRIGVSGPVAEQLGCETEEGPLGAVIRVDATKATSVPGVFACGDAARAPGSLPLAVADGAMAGVAAHRSLIYEGL